MTIGRLPYELKVYLYRAGMKLAHRYNWHHTRLIYPGGDTQAWCTWCGLRQTIKRRSDPMLEKLA